MIVSTLLVALFKKIQWTKTQLCMNIVAFFAFELMYIIAILGVRYRMSKEGAVCSGDY
jgi:glycopeptide antibiotics resistance protein